MVKRNADGTLKVVGRMSDGDDWLRNMPGRDRILARIRLERALKREPTEAEVDEETSSAGSQDS